MVLGATAALFVGACGGSGEGATDGIKDARTPEQIASVLSVTADDLGDSWEENRRESVESSELLPQCHLGTEVDAEVRSVEFENDEQELGALQVVGVFESSAEADAYLDLWRDDPYTCIDDNVVVTEVDFELGGADEAVRLTIGFSDAPQTIRQEVFVVRYGGTVVVAAATSDADADPSTSEALLQRLTGQQ